MRPLLLWSWCCCLLLAAEVGYAVQLDEGAFVVELRPAPVAAEAVVLQMPATAPGTYQVHDWGRFVEGLRALDATGEELPLERLDTNTWRIDAAPRLVSVHYRVRPSFGADQGALPIYGMAGTAIAPDHILVNHFGICAYLRGQEDLPLRLRYRALPEAWTLACALEPRRDGQDWSLLAEDYAQLADSPLLGGALASERLQVDGAEILFAAYNVQGEYGLYQGDWMRRTLEPVVRATRSWLGGLPVERYAFLIYSSADELGHMGALEHRQSSLYLLPSLVPPVMLRQIGAHEFFHIVTPLNIRTALIDRFDFGRPVPPRHLWFYEGVTEYASHLVLRHAGLIDDAGFLGAMQAKFTASRHFDPDLSLIELSEGSLGPHADAYMNVYLRGALLAMAFDLELRRLSAGRSGLRELVLALLEAHGPERSIPTDGFFERLGACSDPAIVPWLERHIAGAEPPDYAGLLAPAGIHAWATEQGHHLRLMAQPSAAQLAFRRAWLEGREGP